MEPANDARGNFLNSSSWHPGPSLNEFHIGEADIVFYARATKTSLFFFNSHYETEQEEKLLRKKPAAS